MHCDEGAGDVLVFLTGQDEIEAAERMINERAARLDASASGAATAPRLTNGSGGDGGGGGGGEGAGAGGGARPERLLALPIYASLPPEQQMRVRSVGGGEAGCCFPKGGLRVFSAFCNTMEAARDPAARQPQTQSTSKN